MRVWLAGFVVIFVGIELFDWFAQLGSVQASGMWLILGGMGLAVASNWQAQGAGQLESQRTEETTHSSSREIDSSARPQVALDAERAKKAQEKALPNDGVDRSGDSVSFKVRFPWQ